MHCLTWPRFSTACWLLSSNAMGYKREIESNIVFFVCEVRVTICVCFILFEVGFVVV